CSRSATGRSSAASSISTPTTPARTSRVTRGSTRNERLAVASGVTRMSVAEVAQAAGLRTPIRHQLFIGGRCVDALSGETLPTLNPHDNPPVAGVGVGGAADVDRAVEAATAALPAWRKLAAADRGRIL